MSKEAFESWKPNPASAAQLKIVSGIVDEFANDEITITLRQLHYQLVSRGLGPNTQRAYKNLGNLLSRARLAGRIDWDAIEDRARRPVVWQSYDSIQQCAEEAAMTFTLPRWKTQPEYVELWCEKDALWSVIEPICSELFTTGMVQRGYGSSSAMYESAKRIKSKRSIWQGEPDDGEEIERPATIIYLGDFDPSGEDMVRDIRDRLALFEVDNLTVDKLALNPNQIKKWNLPPNPLKTNASGGLSDSRGAGFQAEHGDESYEVDAIPPKDLQKMIRAAITGHMDMDAYRAILAEEAALKTKLKKAVAGIR